MSTSRLALAVLLALLVGCASLAQQDAARQGWEARDAGRARACRGAYMSGSCISVGGGP
jgi:uncharacterized protein YceK